MSNQTQSKPNYLRDTRILYYVNLKRTFSDSLFFSFFVLENGVMTTPKRLSFLSFIFTCVYLNLFLIIIVKYGEKNLTTCGTTDLFREDQLVLSRQVRTVEALVSGHSRAAKKASATGAGRLRE